MASTVNSEIERLNALRSYHILDTPPEAEFDRLTTLASGICGVPIALISLMDEDRQWFKSRMGLDVDETPRCVAFCRFTIMGDEILEVEDALHDERFAENPLVTGAPFIRFYAGYPLIDPQGFKLGTICVIDTKPRRLTDEQRNALRVLAELTLSAVLTRRRMEEESYFRKIFDLSNDLICVVDNKGVFRKINPAFTALLGWTEEEMIGKSIFAFIPTGEQQRSESRFGDMNNGLIPEHFTNKTLKRDGSWIYTQWVSVAEEETGLFYCVGRDITTQKEQEKRLRRVNEFLEQTGRVSDTGGWEVDLQSETIYWTTQTRRIHEVEDDFEPNMERSLNFYLSEDRQRIREAVTESISNGTPYDLELRIITAKGREIWVRAIGEAEFEDGVCKRLFGTFQNIDQRKREEIASRQTREMLDNVLKAATEVSIIATGSDGIITIFNSGAENLTGYKAEEMIGKQTPSILHKDKQAEPNSDFGHIVYDASMKGTSSSEMTYVRKDGSEYTGSLVINVIRDSANEITGYLGISTDISEQKRTERILSRERAQLTAFVEHAPAAVAMFDTDIRYIACSRQWQVDYQLRDQNVIGLSHYSVFPNIGKEWKEIHKRALQGEIIRTECDVWRPVGWNEDQYLRWEVRPWQEEDGTVGGIMMFTEDITERIKEQDELKAAKLQAEEASRAKSDFLASMSHEIRTPLNGVIGFADLLLNTKLNDIQRQYLQIINQSGNALLGIVNDILDFSKIEAGKLDLDISEFDLYEMASQAANVISYQAQKKGVEVLLNMSSDLPRFATGDPVRIRQVILNLLSNAVKFTEKGEIELKVFLIPGRKGSKLRFEVRDTGIGIRLERQSRIFEAFMQEDTSTTRRYGGTGLGLSISNRLLFMMGSKMELVSAPGRGSTFFFELELPFRYGEATDVHSDNRKKDLIKAIEPEDQEALQGAEAVTILVAEDNMVNMLLARTIISRAAPHARILEAENGQRAVELFYKHQPDLVLMDIQMPELNGYEATARIRESEKGKTVPIVALTAASIKGEREKCIEAGMNDYITKPFVEKTLSDLLSTWLYTGRV